MKTSSFFTCLAPGRISIARSQPRGKKRVPEYKPLAPGPWFKTAPYEEYLRLYLAQLEQLDAQQVWKDLHEIAEDAEPVLLCWEKPPFDTGKNFCHRRMAAEWLAEKLGEEVPEL